LDAKEAGASFALVLTPSTWAAQMTKDTIIRFHQDVRLIHLLLITRKVFELDLSKVADTSPIPVMLYNFPRITAGIDLDSDMIIALAQHPNIVGVKLTCANMGKLHRITSTIPSSEFAVFGGKSDILLQGLLEGAAGGMTALPNIAPKVHVRLLNHFHSNNLEEAWKIQRLLAHGEWACSKLSGIAAVKAIVVREFKYGSRRVRAPLKAREDKEIEALGGLGRLEDVINLEKSL